MQKFTFDTEANGLIIATHVDYPGQTYYLEPNPGNRFGPIMTIDGNTYVPYYLGSQPNRHTPSNNELDALEHALRQAGHVASYVHHTQLEDVVFRHHEEVGDYLDAPTLEHWLERHLNFEGVGMYHLGKQGFYLAITTDEDYDNIAALRIKDPNGPSLTVPVTRNSLPGLTWYLRHVLDGIIDSDGPALVFALGLFTIGELMRNDRDHDVRDQRDVQYAWTDVGLEVTHVFDDVIAKTVQYRDDPAPRTLYRLDGFDPKDPAWFDGAELVVEENFALAMADIRTTEELGRSEPCGCLPCQLKGFQAQGLDVTTTSFTFRRTHIEVAHTQDQLLALGLRSEYPMITTTDRVTVEYLLRNHQDLLRSLREEDESQYHALFELLARLASVPADVTVH